MTRHLKSIALITILVGSAGAIVIGSHDTQATREHATAQADSSPELIKVSRYRPWPVPGGGQCRTPVKTSSEQIDGAEVQVKTFRCLDELPLADVDFYYSRGEGHLYVRTELLAVKNLWAYAIDGRTFAYRASYLKAEVRSDGSRQYAGVVFIFNYYDEDGDGKFETRYGELPSIKLPEWYKGK